ncbi:MAG TPA: hypothetical protein VHT91_37390 [Kofleriaceae bacterium]|jgi:hypothetical protein|nr:hypothetical protein [Kofleriaceae bacterium]
MHRLVFAAVLGAAAVAQAQPSSPPAGKPGKPAASPPARLPAVDDALGLDGVPGTPKLDWLYDVPSPGDAAGKVVIHWFCAPRIAACTDDLARVIALRDAGRVYLVAYINGSKAEARKLDPIRESEGVGRGTVAFGRGATKLMKDLGVTGPASIIVGVDGKVVRVTTSGAPGDLDARDAAVKDAVSWIHEYVTITDGPGEVQLGEKFELAITIRLASWLRYSTRTPMEFDLTAPSDLKCNATRLRGEQIKVDGRRLSATVTCSGPRGSYEARGELRFGYDAPGGGTGMGAQSYSWKFEIKP